MAHTSYRSWNRPDDPIIDLTGHEPVSAVVLAGAFTPSALRTAPDVARVTLRPGTCLDYPVEFLPALLHLARLREEGQVRTWLEAFGVPHTLLDSMIEDGKVIRIRSANHGRTLQIPENVSARITSVRIPTPTGALLYPFSAHGREPQRIPRPVDRVLRGDAGLHATRNRIARGVRRDHVNTALAAHLPALLAGECLHLTGSPAASRTAGQAPSRERATD